MDPATNCHLCNQPSKSGAFQSEFNDEGTEKEIVLTWTFSTTDGKVVSVCNDCSAYILGSIAKKLYDGDTGHIMVVPWDKVDTLISKPLFEDISSDS
jgi:hypothetical protein